MSTKLKLMVFAFVAIVAFCLVILSGCSQVEEGATFSPNVSTVGVWWWHTSANTGIDPANIDFAAKNGVTEIYYATSSFSQRHSDFVKRANQNKIKVYLLLGEWQWINDDTAFHSVMAKYIAYQESASSENKFAGVHLDVEPHQSPEFATKRSEILERYLNFVIKTVKTYPGIKFDFDIPFWLNDQVMYKQKSVPLYEAIISEANRVVIMSYRTTSDKIYNLGTVPQQIEFAATQNKQIFLSVECANAGSDISFADKGRNEMYAELNKLKELVNYDKLGIAIHHMKAWLELQN